MLFVRHSHITVTRSGESGISLARVRWHMYMWSGAPREERHRLAHPRQALTYPRTAAAPSRTSHAAGISAQLAKRRRPPCSGLKGIEERARPALKSSARFDSNAANSSRRTKKRARRSHLARSARPPCALMSFCANGAITPPSPEPAATSVSQSSFLERPDVPPKSSANSAW